MSMICKVMGGMDIITGIALASLYIAENSIICLLGWMGLIMIIKGGFSLI
jgi:hypothetical protein